MALKKYAIPDDWSEEQDGYLSVLFCIPNSAKWRGLITAHIETLTFGRLWKRETGTITDAQSIGRDIFNSMAMGCIEELVKTNKALIAAITGQAADLTTPLPDEVDYTEIGLGPTLRDLLEVDRLIYSDMNVAEVLFEALVGRKYEGLPLPFEGVGLADIADEQLAILHNRFVMTDGSIFNPLTDTKNIVETLETLLRTDRLSDLEFLTPNITTLFNQVFKLENDNPMNVLFWELYAWLVGDPPPELPEYNTVAELLLLIARSKQGGQSETGVFDAGFEDLVDKLEEIRGMLETRLTAETTAGNTRADQLEAVIDAVENILGGDFVPPE